MKNCPLEAIQLTSDGSDVLKIGSVVWANVDLKYRHAYLKHKNIKYGGKEKLWSVVVLEGSRRTSNPAATGPVSSSVQRGNGTVFRSKTRPYFLLVDGEDTLYRVANVLCEHKECYVATKNAMDRSQLDSVMAHPVEWITMINAYNKAYDPAEPDMSIDFVHQYNQFDVFAVDEMDASKFDENLSVGEFMQLVGYMEGQYATYVKRYKVSDDHGDFMDYTNGLIWMPTCAAVLFLCLQAATGSKHASSIDNRMNDLNRANNANKMMLCTDERDAAKEKMEEIDDRLTTMKSMQKIAKTCGKEFADEIDYKRPKKKSTSIHHKYK
ncbi:hypothetical protein ACHAW6_014742 [Cyclotella cf. meneghiniana]